MFNKYNLSLLCLSLAAFSTMASAATMDISLEIPQIEAPKYHRPYVAVWVESFNQERAAELAVWYKIKAPNNKGAKWLPDLSYWWKGGGQNLRLPVDGVTGATRGPGVETLHFDTQQGPLKDLKPGKYYLSVEVAREINKDDTARERVLISFSWPPAKPEQRQTKGKAEIGAVSLQIAP